MTRFLGEYPTGTFTTNYYWLGEDGEPYSSYNTGDGMFHESETSGNIIPEAEFNCLATMQYELLELKFILVFKEYTDDGVEKTIIHYDITADNKLEYNPGKKD